ncbi:MAG: protein of unknown function with transrane region [Candidatus Kaiserbacteria bacterium]|nr:protein of unknown function with transrane region [Candidatus Kaiserbacteria bacterium]
MHPVTLAEGIVNVLYAASIFTFKWVPATVISLNGSESIVTDPTYSLQPITEPVSISQAADYLSSIAPSAAYEHFLVIWGIYVAFSIFISIILFAIVVYSIMRMRHIHHAEHDRYHHAAHAHEHHIDITPSQLRWDTIVQQANGEETSGWRVAILEADIMLGDLLDTLGYKGETMGDKMKIVNRSQFNSIDLAWEAHRTRNIVAHEGSRMVLTQRETQQTIAQYAAVFKEFGIIK